MPHNRFYIDSPLEETISLRGDELHHLAQVMRNQEGAIIELINGKDLLAKAKILSLHHSHAQLHILTTQKIPPLLPPLTLVQALPKLTNLKFILQKGTELGVSTFYLYPATLSEKKTLSDNQKIHLQSILITAIKQCGRYDLPTIKWGLPNLEGTIYFGDVDKNATPLSSIGTLPATLIIGPEKGFTSEEIAFFRKKGTGVSIAPYTLRSETAAIAALSILALPNRRTPRLTTKID